MVLEAREKAEKVGYPIVGEEVKDASNVVDYDIHEEITIDTSSVFNANNDTTTGMANVIPGVNAPKLLISTSVYDNSPNSRAAVTASASIHIGMEEGDTKDGQMRPLTLSNQQGDFQYTLGDYFDGYPPNTTGSCVIIPLTGLYEIKVTYFCTVGVWHREYDMYVNLDKVCHFQNDIYYSKMGNAYPTETVYLNLKSGDQVAFKYIAQLNGGGSGLSWSDVIISAVITKT